MSLTLRPVTPPETDELVPILRDADEDEQRVRAMLVDGLHTSYAALDGERLIGAVTMRWEHESQGEYGESEIEYIAVLPALRGQGYGKALIAAIQEEARRRGVAILLVGTDNTAFDAIAFYQKCGFRMDHVRRDFFSYVQPPIVNNGIVMRDMLILRFKK